MHPVSSRGVGSLYGIAISGGPEKPPRPGLCEQDSGGSQE